MGVRIRIYMKVAQNELDKAVVQAYGMTTQRLTTADIGRVTAEEIERQPVMNPLLGIARERWRVWMSYKPAVMRARR